MTYSQPYWQDTHKGKRLQETIEWGVFFFMVISSVKMLCVKTEKMSELLRAGEERDGETITKGLEW